MDCISHGLARSWLPVTWYRWKCLACCAHQRRLFQHSHKFLLCKDVSPGSAHYFIAHLPRVTRVYRYQCRGQILIFTNNCLVFQTFQIRRTAAFECIKTLEELPGFKEEPVVIWLIQIFCVDHGLYMKNGYLIFLRIVIMSFKNRHDTQQGFVEFIIPAQQYSTSLVSHRSSHDSTKASSIYLPPNW